MKKKTRKVWMKIDLLETSCVGIPSYPDAHLSFIKALKQFEADEQLNIGPTMEKEEQPEQEEATEPAAEETTPETPETDAPAEAPSEEKEEDKIASKIEEVLVKAFDKVSKKLETERGLVMTEDAVLKELKEKSAGELGLMCGLFGGEFKK